MPPKIQSILLCIASTEQRRKIIGYLILLGLLLGVILLFKIPSIIPTTIVGFLIVWSCLLHVARSFRALKLPNLRSRVRLLRKIRKAFQIGILAKFLYGLTTLLCIIFVVATIVSNGSALVVNIIIYSLTSVFCAAVIVDSWQRLNYLYQYEWFVSIVKWGRWGIGAAAAFISLAASKQITHSLVHVDPKFFHDFSNLISVTIYPLVLLSIVAALLGFFAVAQMAFLFLLVAFQTIAKPATEIIPNAHNARFLNIFWRLVRGKRVKPDLIDNLWSFIYVFSRPFGTVVVSVLIFQLISISSGLYSVASKKLLNQALVFLEFRVGNSCKGILPNTPLAYLDRGNVLVQKISNSNVQYEVKECVYNK